MEDHKTSPAWMQWLATGSYLGYSPIAPGTVGALWGIPLTLALAQIPSPWVRAAVLVGLCLLGVPLCGRVSHGLQAKDPSVVVYDEIVSLPITFWLISTDWLYRPGVLLCGFALNRLFDVSKPPPIRNLERLPGGWGIMSDDWGAGVASCLVLHAILAWF